MKVTIRIPIQITSELLANLLGMAGLLAVAIGAGGLTNWWVSAILGGVACIFLSWVAVRNMEPARPRPAAVPPGGSQPAAARITGRGA